MCLQAVMPMRRIKLQTVIVVEARNKNTISYKNAVTVKVIRVHNSEYILSDTYFFLEDMMDFITMSNKKVRLVIIDYAGLSTNPDDIKEFGR